MVENKWQILDDEEGEIVICTGLKKLTFGWEYDAIARMEYSDAEEQQLVMKNFEEIVKAHNSKVPSSESGMPKATHLRTKNIT